MKSIMLMCVTLLLLYCRPTGDTIEFRGETMGTTYSVKVIDNQDGQIRAANLKSEVDELLHKINMQMSTYIPESEISQFNKSKQKTPFKVSTAFMQVLQLSFQINSESDGSFDPTVMPVVNIWGFGRTGRRAAPPSDEEIAKVKSYVGMHNIKINGSSITKQDPHTELDFSAVAKGYGVDEVAGYIAEKGFISYMVEIGGEVVTSGRKADGSLWRIAVDKPDIKPSVDRNFQAVLNISDVAVATSGDYRNYFISKDSLYSHTIDPVTCRPIINGVASVTVIAPSCALADAMATAIMVMGEESGLQWVESKPDIEIMIIVRLKDHYGVTISSGFGSYLEN